LPVDGFVNDCTHRHGQGSPQFLKALVYSERC